jgi:hypothetical protein
MALAEALFVVRVTTNVPNLDRHALWLRQRNSTRDVFLTEAAAILAALPPDWCGHEAEIARLRLIEEAAREWRDRKNELLAAAENAADDPDSVGLWKVTATWFHAGEDALRAALEADR